VSMQPTTIKCKAKHGFYDDSTLIVCFKKLENMLISNERLEIEGLKGPNHEHLEEHWRDVSKRWHFARPCAHSESEIVDL
jgi:hypothetical protein